MCIGHGLVYIDFSFLSLAASLHAESSKEMEAAVQRGGLPRRNWNDHESTAWSELYLSIFHHQQRNWLGDILYRSHTPGRVNVMYHV